MSPRPKKTRTCSCPLRECHQQLFKPAGTPLAELEIINLEHDELEALVLCDENELSQQAAGIRMGVSRGTVQRLLTSGRKKVVAALATGKALAITSVRHAVPAGTGGEHCSAPPPCCAAGTPAPTAAKEIPKQ